MPVDAILIQPKTGAWDAMSLRLPESLLAISALPIERGFRIAIIDQRLEKDWRRKIADYLASEPLCVGITSMTGEQLKHVMEIAEFIKSNSEAPIVLGGPHATLLPAQTAEYKNIDIVAVGEGDYSFYEILNCLKTNGDLQQVKGVYYKKNNQLFFTGPRELINDLNILPEYDYSLVDISRYETFDLGRDRSISIMTSRGCPHKCKFCAIPVIYPLWRGYSVEKVIAKIKKLRQEYNINNFYFQDDNLGANPTRFMGIIKELMTLEKPIKWGTLGMRADTINRFTDEELELICKSGCHDLDIGVETGSQRVSQFMNKGESIGTIIEANRRLARFPIKLKYTFIIGLPTETKAERKESVALAQQLHKENPHAYTLFFTFSPIIGTAFFQLALDYGFKAPQSLAGWANLRFDDWLEKYSSWLSKKEIAEVEEVCLVSFFANKNVAYKFTRPLLKILLLLYNPFARLRFQKQFFDWPIEVKLRSFFFTLRDYLLKL
ncbi:MAG: radical SAM protein [bacterium]